MHKSIWGGDSMDLNEAKKTLINGYEGFGFKYGFGTMTEDNNGVYLTFRVAKCVITNDDIRAYAAFSEKKPGFESPLSCGICTASYREHILITTDPYPVYSRFPFVQSIPISQKITVGIPSKDKIYAEIGPLSDDFLNFFRLNRDFHLSFNMTSQRGWGAGPPPGSIPPEQVIATNIRDTYNKPTTIKVFNLFETSVQNALVKSSKIIEDCLFQLSYLKRVALWLMEEWPNKRYGLSLPQSFQFGPNFEGFNFTFPPSFNSDVIRFYLLGMTSRVPELSFLAFYQVLEYFFVSVSNEQLYEELSHQTKDPKFISSSDQLDRLVQTVDKHKRENNETEMLKSVLTKFVDESELMKFISSYERHLGQNVYTKKHDVFGTDVEIRLQEKHTIGNTAKHIKETRDALVHSTDRYEGGVRHIPFTKTTSEIERDIPLIKFLAQRAIISSAKAR